MACSCCNASPCCCPRSTASTEESECTSPGVQTPLSTLGGYDTDACPKELSPFRGFDSEGEPIEDLESDFKAAFAVQDDEGNVKWTDRPPVDPPEFPIGVAETADAEDPDNFVDELFGRNGGEMVKVVGKTGIGLSTMVWTPTAGFTLVPVKDPPNKDLCTVTGADFTISPGDDEITVMFDTTEHMQDGVSIVMDSREFIVVSVIDNDYVILRPNFEPTAPETFDAETPACIIGFRPCTGVTEDYADNLVACKDGAAVGFTFPEDVNGMKVPGLFWRDQNGNISFIGANVDSVTGIIEAAQVLRTPDTPAASAANLPSFTNAAGLQPIARTSIWSVAGAAPTEANTTVDAYSITGVPESARYIMLSVEWKIIKSTGSGCSIWLYVNGVRRAGMFPSGSYISDICAPQFLVEIPEDGDIDMETTIQDLVPGGNWAGSSLEVFAEGYIA